jgi:hypothetical protein
MVVRGSGARAETTTGTERETRAERASEEETGWGEKIVDMTTDMTTDMTIAASHARATTTDAEEAAEEVGMRTAGAPALIAVTMTDVGTMMTAWGAGIAGDRGTTTKKTEETGEGIGTRIFRSKPTVPLHRVASNPREGMTTRLRGDTPLMNTCPRRALLPGEATATATTQPKVTADPVPRRAVEAQHFRRRI